MKEYTIDRPKISVVVYLLAVVIIIGLITLGIAAYAAFSKVAGPTQALFAAALIEISAIVEAIALVRGKNWIGLAGLAVSIAVSGTYNYIQAEQAGRLHGITDTWQLLTLAFGPLSALAFLSLTMGQELRKHEAAVIKWQVDRARWMEQQDLARKAEIEQARKEQTDREERERQDALAREQMRIDAETKAELARIRARARESSRKAEPEISGNFPGDWRKLPAEDKAIIAELTTAQIVQRYQVSDRTARNWKANAHSNGKGRA